MNSRVTIILVIMAIYLAGMLWIGLKGRKYSETNKDFMTAAKQGRCCWLSVRTLARIWAMVS